MTVAGVGLSGFLPRTGWRRSRVLADVAKVGLLCATITRDPCSPVSWIRARTVKGTSVTKRDGGNVPIRIEKYSDPALQSGRTWIEARIREMFLRAGVKVSDFTWDLASSKHRFTVNSKIASHSITIEDLVLRRVLDTFSLRPRFEATLQALVDGIATEDR